ncbi:MAG: LytTR family DNA-binding domain-containing protein [Parafilimonas sp.]
MRTLIIEDEPKNIKILRRFITDYLPTLEIIGEAQDAESAEELYNSLHPDIMLLDIQLRKGNAFDFLDKIIPISCAVIFITAYDNHALRAFKYSAVDYLLKPVNISDLKNAVKKAEEKMTYEKLNLQIKQLLDNIKTPQDTKIALPIDGKLIFINTNEIIYFKAFGTKTTVCTLNDKIFTASKTIGEFEEILPNKLFFRVHNSYIVNTNFITKYIKGRGGFIEMQDGVKIEVAARRKDEFLSRFNI